MAQMMAVTAMLVIASVIFYAREGRRSCVFSEFLRVLVTDRVSPAPGGQVDKRHALRDVRRGGWPVSFESHPTPPFLRT